jgi:hypothetical protein
MLIELDAESGAVRLDDEGFAALLAAARADSGADAAAVAALESERLGWALTAVDRPVVTLELVVAGAASSLTHRAWVDRDCAALLLGVREGLLQLMAAPPAYVASSLVRLTRLQPRRVDERVDVPFPASRLPDLVDPDPARRTAALADAGAEVAWQLAITWTGGRRELTAVDGPGGVRLAEPGGDTLRAVTNTELYRILTTALPPEALLPAAV